MKKVLSGIEKISMGTQEIEVRPASAGFGFKVCCRQRNCTKNVLLILSLQRFGVKSTPM